MTALIISEIPIRQDAAGRFCLNDLHKASGGASKHRPSEWLRINQAKELIREIEKAGIPAIQSKQQLGTFAIKELVYAYAMWVSPVFNLHVIRTFDALVAVAKPVLSAAEGRSHVAELPPPPAPETVTLTKDDYIALQAKVNGLLESRIELLELKASAPPRRRSFSDAEKRTIQALHAEGQGPAKIAAGLGRSKNSVDTYLRGSRAKRGAA